MPEYGSRISSNAGLFWSTLKGRLTPEPDSRGGTWSWCGGGGHLYKEVRWMNPKILRVAGHVQKNPYNYAWKRCPCFFAWVVSGVYICSARVDQTPDRPIPPATYWDSILPRLCIIAWLLIPDPTNILIKYAPLIPLSFMVHHSLTPQSLYGILSASAALWQPCIFTAPCCTCRDGMVRCRDTSVLLI